MGFFSELKNDLSQAVNTLMPDEVPEEETLDFERKEEDEGSADIDRMLDRLEEEPEREEEPVQEPEPELEPEPEPEPELEPEPVQGPEPVETVEETFEKSWSFAEEKKAEEEPVGAFEASDELEEKIEQQTEAEIHILEPKSALEAIDSLHINKYVANVNAETEVITRNGGMITMDFEHQTPTDEVATITEGMIIKGDMATTGSLDLVGKVTGNIKCLGKLNITGEITGDSDAAEVYAESARITGELRSKGSVKIGQSTVIVGNIYGSSAVIAGAVKGDIDVHGPVVLDTTAIVMGNIKSQSVQINNGAVIEGMCSQAYADVNPSEFFEGLKNR